MRDERDRIEVFKHMNEKNIEASMSFFKTVFLMNGGAAIAVLGFVASVAKENQAFSGMISGVAQALMLFAWGVVASASGIAIIYITGYFALKALHAEEKWSHPVWTWLNCLGHVAGIIVAIAALWLFASGALSVKIAILASLPGGSS